MRKVFLGAVVLVAVCDCKNRPPEVLTVLPDFTMTAIRVRDESPFSRKDMLGRVWLADFVYTHCEGPCPLLSQRMARLAKELPQDIGLMSVTVDPERDTPKALREYAGAFGADLSRWVFLRGSSAQTYHLLFAGFRQPVSVDPGAPSGKRAMHSTQIALVDRKGGVRGFYDGLSDLGNAALARDARRLLEEGL